jgi:predicted kinase
MGKNKLYIMIGIPGSGKTTYAKYGIMNEDTIHISRDEIRFSLLSDTDNYFAKEKQVYKEFIKQINDNLQKGYNVIADATHLNRKSRNALFHNLHIDRTKVTVIGVYINTPLETCLERNETRKGGRTFVPPHEVHNMYLRTEPPTYNEPFDYIYTFDGKTIKLLERR